MEQVHKQALALRERFDSGDNTAVRAIEEEADKYSFYHNIEIVPGLLTRGIDWTDRYVERILAAMNRFDFKGKRVLDIGCRDGAACFAAEKLGASEIIGIDNDLSVGLTDFLIPFKNSKVKAVQRNLNDLSSEQFGSFDIVIFAGVLYHLRYPFWGLRRIAEIMKRGGILIIEGGFIEGFADLPVLFCPIGSDSPYEATSVTFFNEAGLIDTLESIGFSEIQHHETFHRVEEEQKYLAEKFPGFFEEFCQHPKHSIFEKMLSRITGKDLQPHKLSVCRKIFSCTKNWSDDARISGEVMRQKGLPSQQEILEQYWDSAHEIHNKLPIDPNN